MRFKFIHAERANYPVRVMCRVLRVSTSGYYAQMKRAPSKRQCEDGKLKLGDVLRFLSKKNDVWFPKLKPVPVMGTEKENHTSWERYYRVSDCSSSSRNNWYLGR